MRDNDKGEAQMFRVCGKENCLMKALFVITKRDNKDEVKIYHTDDMAKAICMQYSLFLNKSIEEVASTISDQEIDAIVKKLYNFE